MREDRIYSPLDEPAVPPASAVFPGSTVFPAVYRGIRPRSSDLVHMRPVRLAEAERIPGTSIAMSRPRGYFGVGRDRMSLDGISPPPGLSPGVPGLSISRTRIDEEKQRSVVAEFHY